MIGGFEGELKGFFQTHDESRVRGGIIQNQCLTVILHDVLRNAKSTLFIPLVVKNGSIILCLISGEMPLPESWILKTMWSGERILRKLNPDT